MEAFSVYRDMAERTGGDIYIGVVGPVRTGKSTLVKKFLEFLVLPAIADPFERQRTVDEMPQSGAGRTVMTAEPKFIPADAVEIALDDSVRFRMRLVDCVGFPVEGALGYSEEYGPRLVTTPWFDYDVPFEEAAEVGTRKVIADHSTIGLVVTTDGSFGEIPRENFEEAERRTVAALREVGKPFLIVLNSARPHDPATRNLAASIEAAYGATVVPLNCLRLDRDGLTAILQQVLYEFPVQEVRIELSDWVEELPADHALRHRLGEAVARARAAMGRVRDVEPAVRELGAAEVLAGAELVRLDLGTGTAVVAARAREEDYFEVLREISGADVRDRRTLLRTLRVLAGDSARFERLREAWEEAGEIGYGVVTPRLEDMDFKEPELVRKGNQFGVRLRAQAPSFHIIRADVEAEYTPILGTERQSEDLMNYLIEKFEDDPRKIWESNIFGKSLNELLRDGIRNKLEGVPEGVQKKFQETLQRVVNEGSGGLICIII